MTRVCLAALACCGCGRFGFDPVAGPAGDASDARTADAHAYDAPPTCPSWSPFSTPQLLPPIVQSTEDDWMGTPTLGNTLFYFYSYRSSTMGYGDIYSTPMPFATPTSVTELNTQLDERQPTLPDDTLEIIFARADIIALTIHLMSATRSAPGDTFSTPVQMPVVNSPGHDFAPWVSFDGLRFIFMSDRSGQSLLYETTRTDRALAFDPPVVHPELGVLDSPTMSADALDIWFAAPVGSQDDVFTAHRTAVDQPFGAPVAVPELSSPGDDLELRLTPDGTTMYFNYNCYASGGMNADLYVATRTCL
jgi:hypothetical protein